MPGLIQERTTRWSTRPSLSRTMEERQGLKIACIEEIAFQKGYIGAQQLERLAAPLLKSGYGDYLLRIAREGA